LFRMGRSSVSLDSFIWYVRRSTLVSCSYPHRCLDAIVFLTKACFI
jgi:hypothetical protein